MKEDKISESTIFKLCLTVNIISVIWNIIGDCDETYNYWEPLHFLIFKNGFQTWEYSPEFALRSYLFLWIYGWPAIFLNWIFQSISKYVLFYVTRFYMMTVVSLLEVYLYKGLRFAFKNDFIAMYCVMFFVLSAGSFISVTAFLPSSFALYCSMFAVSAWLRGNYNGVVASIALSSILGWPFAVAIGIPFAVDIIFFQKGAVYFVKLSAFWGALLVTCSVLCDSWYYGTVTFPSLNIVKYNVFNSHGSELYGTESAIFYIKNYLLNFNIGVILCVLLYMIVIGQLICSPRSSKKINVELMILSVLTVWNAVFFWQPHKEERFLFPCYPFLAIAAGICLYRIQLFLNFLFKIPIGKLFSFLVLVVFTLINLSRISAIVVSFNGSMTVYHSLNELQHTEGKTLCLGREWHRFPSNFFVTIPTAFIKSDFTGQLPAKFMSFGNAFASTVRHRHFNDLNREESDRYVPLSQCHFIIDRVDLTVTSALEPNWEDLTSSHWVRVAALRLLSPATVGTNLSPFRSFYVPILFDKLNNFLHYVLLERR